ncbi:MAG: 2'-5' RNA ligase family protein, partial [Planctomycetota bacterium]
MRSFVAAELDEHCRRALERALEQLRAVAAGVRWVKPGALHLTMKFIGELAEADLPGAIEALQGAGAAAG